MLPGMLAPVDYCANFGKQILSTPAASRRALAKSLGSRALLAVQFRDKIKLSAELSCFLSLSLFHCSFSFPHSHRRAKKPCNFNNNPTFVPHSRPTLSHSNNKKKNTNKNLKSPSSTLFSCPEEATDNGAKKALIIYIIFAAFRSWQYEVTVVVFADRTGALLHINSLF